MEKSFGIGNDCYIPDSSNEHNYLIDTCAIDKGFLLYPKDVEMAVKSLNKGYKFYITELQYRELSGVPDRKGNYDDWKVNPNREDNMAIISKIEAKRVSCYAHPMYPYFVMLDSTYRIMDDVNSDEKRVQMFYKIYNNNHNHLRDAIVAEAAIYNHCKLISKDGRFVNRVNEYFPNIAMTYNEFIKTL